MIYSTMKMWCVVYNDQYIVLHLASRFRMEASYQASSGTSITTGDCIFFTQNLTQRWKEGGAEASVDREDATVN